MTFDAKSLIDSEPARKPVPRPDLTVDALVVALVKIQALGLGSVDVRLPDGQVINAVDLVAQGETPAHFVVARK